VQPAGRSALNLYEQSLSTRFCFWREPALQAANLITMLHRGIAEILPTHYNDFILLIALKRFPDNQLMNQFPGLRWSCVDVGTRHTQSRLLLPSTKNNKNLGNALMNNLNKCSFGLKI